MKINNFSQLVTPALFIVAGASVALYTQKMGLVAHKAFQEKHPQMEKAIRASIGGAIGYLGMLATNKMVQKMPVTSISKWASKFIPGKTV